MLLFPCFGMQGIKIEDNEWNAREGMIEWEHGKMEVNFKIMMPAGNTMPHFMIWESMNYWGRHYSEQASD